MPRIACAILCAKGTPRRRMPINARCFVPPLFSTISCASRCSVRSISAGDINCAFSTIFIARNSNTSRVCRACNQPSINCISEHARLHSDAKGKQMKWKLHLTVFGALLFAANFCAAQTPHVAPPPHNTHREAKEAPAPNARPKLVVLLVVDQMRGDYVDKFRSQWTGGLKP